MAERRDNRNPPSRLAGSSRTGRPRKEKSGHRDHRNKKPNQAGKIALIAAVLLVVVLVGAALYGVYGYDRIYPNVTVGDVSLGGMTEKEAEEALAGANPVQNGTLAVTLGEDQYSFEVTEEDFAATVDTVNVVREAMEIGREGGFFSRLFG